MPISFEQFTQQLEESTLLTAAEIEAFRSRMSGTQDVQSFARLLVKEKKLTAFQAQQFYAGKGKTLVLGNYIILDKLGQGGMGMVYRAHHRLMKREVALKVLPPKVSKDEHAVKRFLREVEAVARLNHPNIVSAFDADQSGGTLYLIMEYVAGRDLANVIQEQGPANVEQAVDFVLQAARGLECAHQHGVIHRDIKPANLLLDNSGTVKVLDMGLARIDDDQADQQAGLTGTGTIMGTVDYMSPEQAGDTRSAGSQADIYSLGASLYFLLTGKTMVPAETIGKKIYALMSGNGISQSIREHRSEVPESLDAVFRKMTARSLTDRYATVADLIADLEAVQSGTAEASATGVHAMRAELSIADQFSAFESRPDHRETIAPNALTKGPEEKDDDDFLLAAPLGVAVSTAATDKTATVSAWALNSRRIGILAVGLVLILILVIGFWPDDSSTPTVTPVEPGGTIQNFALSFDGEDDFVAVPSLKMPADTPLTLEMWFVPHVHQASSNLLTWLAPNQISIYQSDTAFGLARKWGERSIVNRETSGEWHVDNRFHLATVWNRDQYRFFVNGHEVETIVVDYDLKDSMSDGLYLGGFPPELLGGETRFVQGTIDEIRISTTARYTEDFVPRPRFTLDDATLALYHCDEGRGDDLRDASPNHHDGKIFGALFATVKDLPE